MSHWIHPGAEAELGDAAAYDAEHASRLVAEAFLVEYERVRDLLAENQQRGPHADFGLRICHFDRFPFWILCEESEERGAQIDAVAHPRREPGYWATRL